ncbi:MAG TPA: hypothetical protein VGJ19_06955 [Streptosporangiaceae bacterium]
MPPYAQQREAEHGLAAKTFDIGKRGQRDERHRESGACDRSTMGEALAEPGITVPELTRREAH